jgi:hypothetical protein
MPDYACEALLEICSKGYERHLLVQDGHDIVSDCRFSSRLAVQWRQYHKTAVQMSAALDMDDSGLFPPQERC